MEADADVDAACPLGGGVDARTHFLNPGLDR